MMRKAMLMAVVAAGVCAAQAEAQIIGAPALAEGAREFSLSGTQPEGRTTVSGSGLVGSYRSTGRMNVAARLGVLGNLGYAELGTFGAVPVLPRVAGIDLGWTAGVGYDVGNTDYGLYVPVGVNASRAFEVRGARITPFANGRVSLAQIDPPESELGELRTDTEVGVDVGAGTQWSVRAGWGSRPGGSQLLLGVAWRR